MTADARMIFVEMSGSAARSASVDRRSLSAWWKHLPVRGAGVCARVAEVGEPILSTVATVSHHEAKVATAALRSEPPASPAGLSAETIVRFCDTVDALIATKEPVAYYSAWVIIESADID